MTVNKTALNSFEQRHLGSYGHDLDEMLRVVGVSTVEELIEQTIPASIRLKKPLQLEEPQTEQEFLAEFKALASKNKVFRSFIGQGYYGTYTPTVILRNILENPGWYTAYTSYQAEIAQGRLEALINYQTLVLDLTAMEISNASLLDEATAAAEAVNLLYAVRPASKKAAHKFFVSDAVFDHTYDVLLTRTQPLGIELVRGNYASMDLSDPSFFGVMLQYPGQNGQVSDYTVFIEEAHKSGLLVAMAADMLALTLLTPPGEMGADAVFGSSQRFGVPMGYGGPHAAFLATRDQYKRHLPGRIIGVSIDAEGKKAYRMALQTREQHIRREKATSNICTAQVLLAVMAGSYAVYHGPDRLKSIATEIKSLADRLAAGLKLLGFRLANATWFDTLTVEIAEVSAIRQLAEEKQLNFFYGKAGYVGISLDETASESDVESVLSVFAQTVNKPASLPETANSYWPPSLIRKSEYLVHPVFHRYHTEHEMLRYLKALENKDLSMVHSMISLGSCTMKLNATSEMIPVTWPEFGQIHPFVPVNQAKGYSVLFARLEKWLAEITGFAAVSLQPNSGAQGEYAGLMVIRAYHKNRGDHHRDVALIPSSAHGTNPASAVMAGMKVVVTACDENGNIDLIDLKAKIEIYKEVLSCLMVTYPSTHGVFEESIVEIGQLVHAAGGQVYMDGANMNAQVGLTSPAAIGADVCHLNLHKTFCIPHGGGGPGMGPICVAAHLASYLPGHQYAELGHANGIHAVSAAPWGSASILPISYAYIAMMGGEGLKKATEMAILNANYLKVKLEPYYPVLYSGANGRCAHEMILDCRHFKNTAGIEVEDIAKRLMDYGFHAPTVSFPVAGTLMIEPTESESKAELDRFCEAMISIRKEMEEIESGVYDKENNVLKHAPHTAHLVTADEWTRPYTRQKAAYPLEWVRERKFWPSVSRIDSAYGDRNLVCSCIPVEEYAPGTVEA